MFEEIGKKLSGMVSIPTVSGKGNEKNYRIREYREYLVKQFPYVFSQAAVTQVGEARLLKFAGSEENSRPVLFTGHMDVVPVQDSGAWKYPPFSGEIVEGTVWGRGAQDMKGPQCAFLSALDQLLGEGWIPKRDIWLYLSCDEEVGGETTVKAAELLKKEGLHFEIVFDEGGTICENFMEITDGKAAMIAIGEKGSLEYRFTALSEGGHSASPQKGSAIVRLGELMHEVEHADIFRRKLSLGSREMLRKMAACHSDEELAGKLLQACEEEGEYPVLRQICREADNLLGSTIAFTMIEGGTAFNVMPRRAVLTANVRISAAETKEEVTEKLEVLAGKHDLICEYAGGRDAVPESGTRQKGFRMMEACVNEAYPGLPVIPFILGGGTDSRYFAPLTDEIVRFSPMYAEPWQGRGVHGDNEAANVEAVREAAMCYHLLLSKYL